MNFKLGDLIDYRTFFNSKYSEGAATIVSKNMIKPNNGDMQAYVGLGIKTGDTWEVYNSFNIDRANLRKLRNASSVKFITINAPAYHLNENIIFNCSKPDELEYSDISFLLSRNDASGYHEIKLNDSNGSISTTELMLAIASNTDFNKSGYSPSLKDGYYELKLLICDKKGEIIISPSTYFTI